LPTARHAWLAFLTPVAGDRVVIPNWNDHRKLGKPWHASEAVLA